MALAQLLSDGADGGADAALGAAPSLPEEPVSHTEGHLRMLRGAARLVGLNAAARRHALQAQLTRLEELRKEVVRKMNSKAVKDSLRELRKYRRPPRAAAQVLVLMPHPSTCSHSCRSRAHLRVPLSPRLRRLLRCVCAQIGRLAGSGPLRC